MNTKNQQILKLQAIKLLNNATMSPTKKYFERQQTGLHNDYTNLIIMRIFLRNQTCFLMHKKTGLFAGMCYFKNLLGKLRNPATVVRSLIYNP